MCEYTQRKMATLRKIYVNIVFAIDASLGVFFTLLVVDNNK